LTNTKEPLPAGRALRGEGSEEQQRGSKYDEVF
jgi:hypothetical protein